MRKQLEALFLWSVLLSLPIYSYAGLPQSIYPPGEKVIVVDPNMHVWGAYSANGMLVKSGVASAGKDWCDDMDGPCRTETGTFRIRNLGKSSCYSPSFPIPKGGSPMPYCMYFNQAQALHGSYHVGNANLSHGCVRMHVADAKWLRFNFAEVGTLVVIRPYDY